MTESVPAPVILDSPLPTLRPASSPFDRLRARSLLGAALAALILSAVLIVLEYVFVRKRPDARLLGMVTMLAMALVVIYQARTAGIQWKALFGPHPTRPLLPLLSVIIPVDVLTYAAAALVFIPLSYVFPGFVQRNLLTPSPVFEISTVPEWLGLMLVGVVIAPLFEEVLFRGLLMQRWARKWGTPTGVVLSSALFAVGHAEIVGHFLFGVAMCALYLRTRSLWLPIVAHATSNGALLAFSLVGVLTHQKDKVESLAEFRSGWWVGLLTLGAGVVLLMWYLRRFWPNGLLRTTLRGPTPYDANAAAPEYSGQAASATVDTISAS